MLYVHHTPIGQVHFEVSPQEFLHEHRYIEAVAVVPAQVAIIEELLYFISHLLKSGRILDHLICDTMNITGELWDGYPRVDQLTFYLARTVRKQFHNGDFNYPVGGEIDPGSLQINEGQRPLELQH